jgi:hypothetical protein
MDNDVGRNLTIVQENGVCGSNDVAPCPSILENVNLLERQVRLKK